VRTTATLLALLVSTASLAAPALAQEQNTNLTATAMIDAALIPDGPYNATVQRVVDNKHLVVRLDNDVVTTVASGRPEVTFSAVKPNDVLKLTLAKGMVVLYEPVQR